MCTPYSQSVVVVLLLWSGGAEKQKKGIEPFQKVSPEATLKSEKKKRERGNEQKQKCSKKTGIRGEELGVYNINSHTSMLQF